MKYFIRYLIPVMVLFFSCRGSKKAVSTPPPVQNPVAVAVVDTTTATPPEPVNRVPYRSSNKRSSDIIHTKLEVSFDWANARMNGKATIEARPYFYPDNMLYLNARGMDIKKVEVYEMAEAFDKVKTGARGNSQPSATLRLISTATYIYENDSLKINLGKIFTAQQHYFAIIDYVAKPNELKTTGGSNAISDDKGLYFVNPKGENPYKMPQIWTQGETQANSVWMPTIDSPNEKMTQEIYMTVDKKYTTLSNGLLVDTKKNADGTRTDHWKQDQPHAPYLAMMAVGEFKKVTGKPWNNKEISYYVEKEYEQHAIGIFGDTKEMIEFFSTRLGVPYAWPKYAQIVVRDYVSGAMENTSATLHGDFVVYQTTREMIDNKKGYSVIAHELFHQWFGDLVTCESWSNLSLNESFATYGEYLWLEYKKGRDEADSHHWKSKQGYFASQKEVEIIRFQYKDKEDMFDGFSYNKGGQVLHMLRKAVGDDAFFAGLKNYLETNKFKAAEIHDLRLAFEEVTGKDMNWFFNQWFLNKGRPKLKVNKVYDAVKGNIELTVEQNQDFENVPLYILPLEVDVYVGEAIERHHIEITDQKQVFTIAVKAEPQLVNFDAERQLLCDLDYKKSRDEYIFQYKNAPLFEDRYEAVKELEAALAEAPVFELFKKIVANDKFYGIRNYAITKLEKVPQERLQETRACLLFAFRNDKQTVTRAKALGVLNKLFTNDNEIAAINESALAEQSYAICGEALESIAKNDVKKAMEKAKLFENERGKDIIFPVANLYATHGGDEKVAFFRSAIRRISGFELLSFAVAYVKVAKRSENPEIALTAATDLENLSKGANKIIKFGLLKGLKDLLAVWENRESNAKTKLETAQKENTNTIDLEKQLAAISQTRESLYKIYSRAK